MLNAGASLYVAGLADSMEGGVRKAEVILDSGAAAERLARLASVSQRFAGTA